MNFYAPDSPPVMEAPARRSRSGRVAIPTLDAPEAVLHAHKALRGYSSERRTLGEQPTRPANDRRRAALALLVDEARAALLDAIAEHRDTWATSLTARVKATGTAYAKAVADLDTARRDATAAGAVLTWLDHDGLSPFSDAGQPRLAGMRPWPNVIAALHTDANPANPVTAEPTTPQPIRPVARSLAHVTATLPELDMPTPLAKPYKAHRELLGRHYDLGLERRQAEEGRRDAEAKDQRELADAIRDGNDDPGDRHVAALDNHLADLDRRRAALSVEITDSYRQLAGLLAEHRADWRTAVTKRHDAAVDRYRQAVTDLADTRKAAHAARAAAAWLDATTPDDLAHWTGNDQPPIGGEMWNTLADMLHTDLNQRTATMIPRPAA